MCNQNLNTKSGRLSNSSDADPSVELELRKPKIFCFEYFQASHRNSETTFVCQLFEHLISMCFQNHDRTSGRFPFLASVISRFLVTSTGTALPQALPTPPTPRQWYSYCQHYHQCGRDAIGRSAVACALGNTIVPHSSHGISKNVKNTVNS